MRPINEKERTLAFVQFLVLFILTIVLTIFFVFFNSRIYKKNYETLKEENLRLKNNLITSTDLPLQIDSLKKIVSGFKNLTEINYEDNRKIFMDDLTRKWTTAAGDSSELDKIKGSLLDVFKDWSYGVGASIRETNKNASLGNKDAEIKQWQEKYENLKTDFDNYKIAHPPH